MQKEKCSETVEDERETGEEGGSDPYSGKVELGCNGGWLGRLPRLMEGEKRYGAVRDRMKGRRGGWRRERGWFSSEVTYLEANLIHSPKEESRGLAERPPSDWTIEPHFTHRILRSMLRDAAWVATEEKRNFAVHYPPVMIHHTWNAKWRNFTSWMQSQLVKLRESFVSTLLRFTPL